MKYSDDNHVASSRTTNDQKAKTENRKRPEGSTKGTNDSTNPVSCYSISCYNVINYAFSYLFNIKYN
jgi:ribosomal protein L19E